MYSKLLNDLQERIRNSTDRVAWARDVCRAAAHFARQGETVVALRWLDSVRQTCGNSLEPEVACWMMLAEGLLHFFQDRPAEAYDRFMGAYGSAVTFKATRALPTCSAWMAHFEFNENRFDSMLRFLEEALRAAPEDDHQARARASLVLADALHFSDGFARARPWYDQTRLHATAEGDGATLSALFHNVAMFRAMNVRMADVVGKKMAAEAKQASMEAASAFNYDAAIGTASFPLLVPLIRGQLFTAEGRFEDGLMALASIKEANLPIKLRPVVAVDKAWCLIHLDGLDHVERLVRAAAEGLDSALEFADRAYVLLRISQIQERTSIMCMSDCAARAQQALETHRAVQAKLSASLEALMARLPCQLAAKANNE